MKFLIVFVLVLLLVVALNAQAIKPRKAVKPRKDDWVQRFRKHKKRISARNSKPPCQCKPTELCKLAVQYGVDKAPMINHYYTQGYWRLFRSKRMQVQSMLEIGIGNENAMLKWVGHSYRPGASLRMWKEFFPAAHIYGCDIVPQVMIRNQDRITTFVTDQSSKESLLHTIRKIGTCDLILDDGSHQLEHQQISFRTLWPSVNPNGMYIIEDIHPEHLNTIAQLATEFDDSKVVEIYKHPCDHQGYVAFAHCPVNSTSE
jgi:hypothetical protein